MIYVFIVPSYVPGEAAFSQYGTGTNILLPCLFPPFPSSHSQSAAHFAHLLKFTRFLHELSQPRNSQKNTLTKAATVKKMQVSWWFRDLDLLRKMTEQSQKHQTRHEILHSSVREGTETSYSSSQPSRADGQSTLESLLDESQLSYPKISQVLPSKNNTGTFQLESTASTLPLKVANTCSCGLSQEPGTSRKHQSHMQDCITHRLVNYITISSSSGAKNSHPHTHTLSPEVRKICSAP